MAKEKVSSLFLKEFTSKLIQNSKKERIFIPAFHPVKKYENFLPPLHHQVQEIFQESNLPPINPVPSVDYTQKSVIKDDIQPRRIEIKERTPEIRRFPPRIQLPVQPPNPILQQITPSPQPIPIGFSLGKIDPLIHDNRITTIECPGPGKFILTKTAGNVNITHISLGEEEIKTIIHEFSRQAKIPIITGLFKAVVGNLVITAVLSDFVGSRFIINKSTPYSLLEQNQQFPSK
ncbi:hypothetical protein FJZ19_05815 [Candidatus Pacearchaeota archaeon]|nr:hypothetical protein [Candidatus Pacearchaeota archaeon]